MWQDDAEVYRNDNTEIPTLELKNYIPPKLLKSYQNLFDKRSVSFINCEKEIAHVDGFVIENWLERLFFERLERKSVWVKNLLKQSKNDWESVFFALLLKNFGLKINGAAFSSLAEKLDYAIVRKIQSDNFQLESIFYGMSHLLGDDQVVDEYYLRLQKEFEYLKKKFELGADGVQKPEFYKLRPSNFPTIRLSQLANLYSTRQGLFGKVMDASNLEALYAIFQVSASEYWKNHYTFGKESKVSVKKLSKKFIDLLIINSILPLKFCYGDHLGKDVNEEIMKIATQITREDNTIVRNFIKQGVVLKNAKDSQAALQLYNGYCTRNKCLQCAVGNHLLDGNS